MKPELVSVSLHEMSCPVTKACMISAEDTKVETENSTQQLSQQKVHPGSSSYITFCNGYVSGQRVQAESLIDL